MINLQKISSYIGFAARARKIVYGADNIINKKRVPVVLVSDLLAENTMKKLGCYAEKANAQLVVLEGNALENILKKQNCKAIAVLDKDLADAIIENA